MQRSDIPVYLFTGFLEGGKTHIIQESMSDDRFNTGEKTLIILCEEGIEELDISTFSGHNIYIATIESESDVTAEMLAEREKKARAVMSVKAPDYRRNNFDEVLNGFTEEQARGEAKRCLECGCHYFKECKLIRYANDEPIAPERLAGAIHESFKETRLVTIERDQGKCILCNLCVRTCKEDAGQSILGLVGRGFKTVIKPEFEGSDKIEICKTCGKCVEVCPTGALKLLK
jgi:formate dehydrogenase major subunit